jgi:ATP-dependent Clp protease, protease subunit
MTIRKLPAAPSAARRLAVQSEISPRALERWNPEIRAAAGSTDNNVISIMDVIGSDFFGSGITANRVAGALRAIGNKPVVVEINSPGGDYFEGLAIYNTLREHPKDVTVKILGVAASAASVIAMAGDTIMVPRAGFLMIHNVWVMAIGDKNLLAETADRLAPFDAVAADIYAARSGMDIKDIVKMLDAETWIGGAEAVEKGLADSLLPSDQVETAKNEISDGPIAAARRIEAALAKGERLPRSERRRLIKEITGTPSAAVEPGTPSAAEPAANDGDGVAILRLQLELAKLKRARA